VTAGYTPYGVLGRGRPGRPRVRLTVTWLVAVLAAGGLVARLVSLQVTPDDRFIASGEDQRFRTIPQVASRGSIVDRNGADLALSVPQTSIVFDSTHVEDPRGDAAALAPVLGMDAVTVQGMLSSGQTYVYLARHLDEAVVEQVRALDLPYLRFIDEDERFLPSGDSFASSIIGRTDGYSAGVSGLEKEYDDVLKGVDGTLTVEQGAGGRTIPGGEQQLEPATPGSDVVVAIDRGLQFEVERLLMQAVDDAKAAGGTVLVSNPETGEVLVDANVIRPEITAPPSDPAATGSPTTAPTTAAPAEKVEPQFGPAQPARENRALSWTYEPGSVNKIITMAGVIEEGLATADTVQSVSSSVDLYGKSFAQETRSTDQDLSLRQILAKSDNPGTISGEERLYRYVRAFGLGELTGIDWEYQSRGSVPHWSAERSENEWSGHSLPTMAIGQGLAVTPLQMLDVYNTIANDGVLVWPRLVLGTEAPDGTFTPTAVPEPRRVVSEATSAAVRDMLTAVVTEGTGSKAQVEGYTVAGKTGTAWEPVPGGGYGTPGNRHLVTTFVGFLPASDPKLSILVVLDDPANPYATGGSLAAPLFQKVAAYAVDHLRIPPEGQFAPDASTERVRAEPVVGK
jgi:cell division protein FtsI (penicillin-binding protein 3)